MSEEAQAVSEQLRVEIDINAEAMARQAQEACVPQLVKMAQDMRAAMSAGLKKAVANLRDGNSKQRG